MGIEREVITVKCGLKFGREVLKYVYDYSALEVGDWFIAKGASRIRSARVSIRTHVKARWWEFEAGTYGERSMKFTRIR